VLKRHDAIGRGQIRAPWVEPTIFLSAVRQKPQLDPGTTRRVFLRGNPGAASDSGIIDALLRADEIGLGRRGFVDGNIARATSAALEQAGFAPPSAPGGSATTSLDSCSARGKAGRTSQQSMSAPA
jgi:hypothetical protein